MRSDMITPDAFCRCWECMELVSLGPTDSRHTHVEIVKLGLECTDLNYEFEIFNKKFDQRPFKSAHTYSTV